MAQKNLNKIYAKIDGGKNNKYGFSKLNFIPTDTEPTAVEGEIYYDDSENKFKMCTDGSTWTAISSANAATTGLDGAYDLNNTITVDGSAFTLTATSTTNDAFQINSAVATAAAKSLVDLVWTGTPNATANMLRLDASGATVTGTPYMQEFVGNAKDIAAIYVDTDSTTDSQVVLHTDGALGAGVAQLLIDNDGTINATGNLLLLDATGATATNTAYAAKIDSSGIDMAGLYVDSDAATDSAVVINGGGAIANNKALLEIVADGTPAHTGSNLLRVDGSGLTATNKPTLLEVVGAGKDVIGMAIDADSVGNVVTINGGGNIVDNAAVLVVTQDGASQTAGGAVLRLGNSGTADTDSRYIEIVGTGVDARAIYCDTDSATNDGIYVLNQGAIAAGKAAVHIDLDGDINATANALLVESEGATATSTAYLVKFSTSTKDSGALYIDTDAATDSGVLITGGGAVADNTAVLEVKWDGTPAAAGSNLVRIDGSGGTNTAKPVLLEILDDSVSVGLSVSTASIEDMVSLTGIGATGNDKAVLDVTWGAITPAHAGANLVRIDASAATTTNKPVLLEVYDDSVSVGMSVSTASVEDMAVFIGTGATGASKSVIDVTSTGAMDAAANLLRLDLTGADTTAVPTALEIVGAGETARGIYVDTDGTTVGAAKFHSGGALTDGIAVVNITNDGNLATGGNLLNVTMGGTPHAAAAAVEIVASKDAKALDIITSAATNSAVKITGVGAVADNMALLHVAHGTGAIANGGSIVRIEGSANAAGATAYGLEIAADGTNLEGLWVSAGAVKIAETLEVTGVTTCTGGVVSSIGQTANLHDTAPVIGDLTTAFGAAYATKTGWLGTVIDSSTSKVYLCSSNGTTFTYTLMATALA